MNSHHMTEPKWWDNGTRFLHMGLAGIVTLQLFTSLGVEAPEPDHALPTGLDALLLNTHEWLGMAALLIVLAHWAWSTWANGGAGLRHLLPWRAADRQKIIQESRGLIRLRMPPAGPGAKLPGLMHGLGLLAVTGMALTGAVLFFWMPENGKLTTFTEVAKELHGFIATFVWIYWGGHAGMAVLHHVWGRDGTLRNMFKLGRENA